MQWDLWLRNKVKIKLNSSQLSKIYKVDTFWKGFWYKVDTFWKGFLWSIFLVTTGFSNTLFGDQGKRLPKCQVQVTN